MNILRLLFFIPLFSLHAERNPFIFSQELSIPTSVVDVPDNVDERQFAPDWHIIECDGTRMTIQHADKTIRHISLLDIEDISKKNPSNLR